MTSRGYAKAYNAANAGLRVSRLGVGGNGAVLERHTEPPPEGAPWKFEWSPDSCDEMEVLVRGQIEGAGVRLTR